MLLMADGCWLQHHFGLPSKCPKRKMLFLAFYCISSSFVLHCHYSNSYTTKIQGRNLHQLHNLIRLPSTCQRFSVHFDVSESIASLVLHSEITAHCSFSSINTGNQIHLDTLCFCLLSAFKSDRLPLLPQDGLNAEGQFHHVAYCMICDQLKIFLLESLHEMPLQRSSKSKTSCVVVKEGNKQAFPLKCDKY